MNAQTIKDRALDARQQNIVMISALTATGDLEQLQLESHIGMNTGLNERELNQAFDLIQKVVNKEQAETARRALAKVAGARRNNQ